MPQGDQCAYEDHERVSRTPGAVYITGERFPSTLMDVPVT
jgi:hypothetical protein